MIFDLPKRSPSSGVERNRLRNHTGDAGILEGINKYSLAGSLARSGDADGWREPPVTEPLTLVKNNVPVNVWEGTNLLHRNYLEYLSYCWSSHTPAVVTPDIIWHTLLCEIASIVKSDPKKYKDFFASSDEVQEISVPSDDPELLPLGLIMEALRDKIPNDATNLFLPGFTTSTDKTRLAHHAAFADAASPFYRYSTYACHIPKLDILGTVEDWNSLTESFMGVTKLLGIDTPWVEDVIIITLAIKNALHNPTPDIGFLQNILYIIRCGSGSEEEVFGWYTDLLNTSPDPRYVRNFPTSVSKVYYTNLTTEKKFVLASGLFSSSVREDGFLVPDFGYFVYRREA